VSEWSHVFEKERFCEKLVLGLFMRFFAGLTLSETIRFFASLRMTGEELRMTSKELMTNGSWFVILSETKDLKVSAS